MPKKSVKKSATTDVIQQSHDSASDLEVEEQPFNDAIEPSPAVGHSSSSSMSNIPPESTMASDSDADEEVEKYVDDIVTRVWSLETSVKEIGYMVTHIFNNMVASKQAKQSCRT